MNNESSEPTDNFILSSKNQEKSSKEVVDDYIEEDDDREKYDKVKSPSI